ncbi:MAG: formylglycine-generating enzyme family protein, partial [Alphaproteobacteria bacterium]|nr:formylglycine-generating enzyme family protein [Alphaproteobacteria bacterium]
MAGRSAGRTLVALAILAGVAGASGFLAAGLIHSEPERPPVPDEYLPQLVLVPAGEMTVSRSGEPRRAVFGRPFLIGRFEVTFDQWDYCHEAGGCAHRPKDRGWGRADRPVIDVSWEDAAQYLEWLSDATGRRYRLPTEDEWAYAARAGSAAPAGPAPRGPAPPRGRAGRHVLGARETKKTQPLGCGEGN